MLGSGSEKLDTFLTIIIIMANVLFLLGWCLLFTVEMLRAEMISTVKERVRSASFGMVEKAKSMIGLGKQRRNQGHRGTSMSKEEMEAHFRINPLSLRQDNGSSDLKEFEMGHSIQGGSGMPVSRQSVHA